MLCAFSNLSLAEVVVPEDVLGKWGYKTTKVRGDGQDIKRIKGERVDENQMYYPRFTLAKSCFDTPEAAMKKQKMSLESRKNDPFNGFKSHYNDFISGECLYSISTAVRATFLSYQPEVLKKYKTYVQEIRNP
ncbi:hypothetical protein GCM10008090_27750 [Arenicella chitinivorans]|uniref:Uncharacterized protein n=2 Tax=Arenicella chitinivorans TaxID=1329800 RepID=A0A918S104_9GAMM|nr:hypothetical protein GCM10008090_27750 [Arenicella chitinivorans]